MIPATFHFLRPEWLLAIIPAVLLALLAWRRLGAGGNPWAKLVDAHLLRHLAMGEARRAHRWPVIALLTAWVLASLAMAGPTWQQLPSPALDRRDPTVVVLSLAQSMNATDQSPTRLGAARHKVEDILKRLRGGQVGLVIFADRPFVASPLTEDGRVVGQMLPDLSTDLMPVLDNRPDLAITQAVDLLKGAGAPTGRIILITDGPGDAPQATVKAAEAAARAGFQLNVIGLGTRAGSPLLAFDGTPLHADDGTALVTRMDADGLARLAATGGGTFTAATADGSDLERILATSLARPGDLLESNGLTADQWADMGPWLLVVVLLLAPLAFRRGWIAILLLAALPAVAPFGREAHAQEILSAQQWRDLWQTPDQQGASAFARDDFQAARRSFEDPQWRASALYKAGDYEAAAAAFAKLPGGDYNRGNALAHAGKLEEAITAYDAALQADPKNADAAYNRNLVQMLLNQKKKDEENKDQQKNQQNQNKNSSGGGGADQKQQDQKDKDQNNKGQNQKDKDGKGQPDKPGDQKPDDKAPGENKGQGQGQGQDGQKTPQQPGKPDKPDKPEGSDKPDGGQGPQPPAQPQPSGPKPPQQKGPQPKPDPAKPDPAKPDPAKTDPAKTAPPKPDPSKAEPAKPAAAQPAQAQKPSQDPQGPPGAVARRAQADADQTKEQMLRMVPDDPGSLLRARIRSHYGNGAPPNMGEP